MQNIDFQRLIEQTLSTGKVTQTEMAAQVGVSSATISKLKHGHMIEPKYSVGLAIVELHKTCTRRRKKHV